MTTTKWTKMISFRMDKELIDLVKNDIREKTSRKLRKVTFSEVMNEIVRDYYRR